MFCKTELFNVFLTVSVFLRDVMAGSLHFEERLNIIGDSNFDARQLPSQTSFIQNTNEVASSIVGSKCRNNLLTKVQIDFWPISFVLENRIRIKTASTSLKFIST